MEDKIDPAFRSIIFNSNPKIKSSSKKVKHYNPIVAGSHDTLSKKYDCIVYTKNAQILHKQGIVINSVLPTFVTASATIKQIIKMASMAEVTYIEAPQIVHVH